MSKLSRGLGFRNVLTAFSQVLEVRNPSNANGTIQTKIQMPSVISMVNKRQELCSATNKAHLEEVFTKFSGLVTMNQKTFENNNYKVARNFSPIELVAVAVLISIYMDTRNDTMLLGDIETMRETIREHLPDLRMDNVTWKTIWQFIEELESFRGASNGSTVPKKTFAPQATTITAKSRIGKVKGQIINRVPNATATLSKAMSTSPYVSARSTPATSRATPATTMTSPESFSRAELTGQDGVNVRIRQRSASFDSVLGDDAHDPAHSPVNSSGLFVQRQSFSAVLAPMASMTPQYSSTLATPTVSGPMVKFENREDTGTMSRKRPVSGGPTNNATISSADLRAQRAKRVKLPSSRGAE